MLEQMWRERFWSWIGRRLPPSPTITLDRFRLFVFPSLTGFGYLIVCLLIWLLGTNYDNNLALAMAFLMISLFVVTIIHTFNNLSGVTARGITAHTAFVGESVEFEVMLSRRHNKRHENIQLSFRGADRQESVATVDLISRSESRAKLFVPALKRGWLRPGRLLVETRYPLGLIRVWSWLDLDLKGLVYPAPIPSGPLNFMGTQQGEGSRPQDAGTEDFAGLKTYQPGHSLRHVAWKQYARGQGLHLKAFADYQAPSCWVDWDCLPGLPMEERLSRLCFWVTELAKTHSEYGVRLPGVEIAPGSGLEHKQLCLKALALYRLG